MNTNPILTDIPEVIETSRLLLQVPKAGFGREVHEAILDGYDEYIKWVSWPSTPPPPESVEKDCRKHHAEFILRDFIRYLIIEKDSKRVIGRFGFPSLMAFWSIPQFGISYFIRKSARKQGYGTEATHALTLFAFKELKAQKVEIHCDAENTSSQRIPQALGFSLECTKKGSWPRPDNKLADIQIYSLFSDNLLPKWEVKW